MQVTDPPVKLIQLPLPVGWWEEGGGARSIVPLPVPPPLLLPVLDTNDIDYGATSRTTTTDGPIVPLEGVVKYQRQRGFFIVDVDTVYLDKCRPRISQRWLSTIVLLNV